MSASASGIRRAGGSASASGARHAGGSASASGPSREGVSAKLRKTGQGAKTVITRPPGRAPAPQPSTVSVSSALSTAVAAAVAQVRRPYIGQSPYVPYTCVPVLLAEFFGRVEHFEAARARWKVNLDKRSMAGVFGFDFADPAEYGGEVGVLVFGDVSAAQVPQLYVGPTAVTRPENMMAFGCNQFHTWTFYTGKGRLVPGFTHMVRGGANVPLSVEVQAKSPASRCAEVKRFLDWYLSVHPGERVFWDVAGARGGVVDLSRYHDKGRKVLVRNDDGGCL